MGYKGPFIHISLGLTFLDGSDSMRSLIYMTSRNVDKLKSIQRIHESMKMYASIFPHYHILESFISLLSVVNLLAFEEIRADKVPILCEFLAHPYPKASPIISF